MNKASDRHQIMKEALFWTRLAYMACGFLRETEDKFLRGFWIDDFLPESVADTKQGVDIRGTAWIGKHTRAMHRYRFFLSVPQNMLHRWQDRFSIVRFDLDEEQRTLQMEIRFEKSVP